MKVRFRSTDPDGALMRTLTLRRVREVLRWMRAYVAHVDVTLDDANGPLPGTDKRCEVRAFLRGGRNARIEATARHWHEAVELATSQLRCRVARHLQGLEAVGGPAAQATAAARHGRPPGTPRRLIASTPHA